MNDDDFYDEWRCVRTWVLYGLETRGEVKDICLDSSNLKPSEKCLVVEKAAYDRLRTEITRLYQILNQFDIELRREPR